MALQRLPAPCEDGILIILYAMRRAAALCRGPFCIPGKCFVMKKRAFVFEIPPPSEFICPYRPERINLHTFELQTSISLMKNFVHKITCVLVMCAATVAFTACSDSDNKGDGPVTGTLSVETGALKFTSGAYSKGFEVGTDGTVGAIQVDVNYKGSETGGHRESERRRRGGHRGAEYGRCTYGGCRPERQGCRVGDRFHQPEGRVLVGSGGPVYALCSRSRKSDR